MECLCLTSLPPTHPLQLCRERNPLQMHSPFSKVQDVAVIVVSLSMSQYTDLTCNFSHSLLHHMNILFIFCKNITNKCNKLHHFGCFPTGDTICEVGWAIKGGFDVRRRVLARGSAPHCCSLLQIFATICTWYCCPWEGTTVCTLYCCRYVGKPQ